MNRPAGDDPPPSPANRRFQTTRWSLVLHARDGRDAEARRALAELCETYWFPLYAFVRRKGYGEPEALDLVQGFFARLLEKGDLASVDPKKGRFRSFLMASCRHYLANRSDHERAKKRGGGLAGWSIDGLEAEGRYLRELSHDLTPERLYERQWAVTLLANVLKHLESEMERAGKGRQFEALRPALLGQAERVPFAEVAATLGVSVEAARAAAKRLRGRYRELLRDEVARTLDDPGDVDEEIRALFQSLGS